MKNSLTKNLVFQILMMISIISLIGCNNDKDMEHPPKKKPQLVILLYDISKSNDDYAILKKEYLRNIFSKIAFNGGGKLYGIHIKSDSKKQEIHSWNIAAFDTLPLKGNRFQISKRKDKNAAIKNKLKKEQEEFIKKAESFILPKTEQWTDLKGALEIAKTTLMQPSYEKYQKAIIIISDGINDLSPKNGEDSITKPFNFENTKVILVRSSRDYFVQSSNIIKTSTINDAIINL